MTEKPKLTHIKFHEGLAWEPPPPPPEWQSVGANLRDGLLASPIIHANYDRPDDQDHPTIEVRFADGRVEKTATLHEVEVVGYFMQKQLERGSDSNL